MRIVKRYKVRADISALTLFASASKADISASGNKKSVLSNGMITSALRPEIVLSENNRKATIERFRSFQLPTSTKDVPEAAVLIPLCLYKGELGLLYTLRSMKLTTNRGQVSFPGGMRDKTDENLQETALRETWEELRIPNEKIDVWTMGNLIGKGTVNVMPVLAYIGEIELEKLEVNPDEVEEAFIVSLKKLCDPNLCSFTRFQKGSVTLPSYLGGKYRVWGFTGAITHIALQALVPNVYMNKVSHVQTLSRNTSGETNRQSFVVSLNVPQSKI